MLFIATCFDIEQKLKIWREVSMSKWISADDELPEFCAPVSLKVEGKKITGEYFLDGTDENEEPCYLFQPVIKSKLSWICIPVHKVDEWKY